MYLYFPKKINYYFVLCTMSTAQGQRAWRMRMEFDACAWSLTHVHGV